MIPPLDNVIWWPDLGDYIKPRAYDKATMLIRCDVLDEEVWRPHRRHVTIPEEVFVALNSEEERFRSFAERYVIERAPMFRKGMEQQDAWAAMLDAKGIYTQIRGLGAATFGTQDSNADQVAQAGPATPRRASTSPVPPVTRADVLDALEALEAAKVAPKKGSLAKLKAAAARIGKGLPKI